MKSSAYDVIVVGLGAVGSSALYQLAKRGARVLGVDRYGPPHDKGSSHGESRIMRQAIGEGEAYVPLVLRSNAIWEEVEAATGARLLERCGFLFITRDDEGTSHHGKSGFLERTRRAAEAFQIEHELIDAATLTRRFPHFVGLSGDETAYYEPGGGYLRPEACIAALLNEGRRLGAVIAVNCQVRQVDRTPGGVTVEVDGQRMAARQVILATGAWISQLAGDAFASRVAVHRQFLHWFRVEDAGLYPARSPTFIWTHGLDTIDQFYGFPPIDNLVKVAREDYSGLFDPDVGSENVDPNEVADVARRHVNGRLAGLSDVPVRSASCHYAVTPDNDFLIIRDEAVTAVSACSGHGFKHASAVGEAVALSALGERCDLDLSSFGARRFNI